MLFSSVFIVSIVGTALRALTVLYLSFIFCSFSKVKPHEDARYIRQPNNLSKLVSNAANDRTTTCNTNTKLSSAL